MATLTVYGVKGDGYVSCNSSTYSAAAGGTGTKAVNTSNTYSRVGQYCRDDLYYVFVSGIGFDTSSLDDGCSITDVALSLYRQGFYQDNEAYYIRAYSRDWGTSLTTDDFIAASDFSSYDILASIASTSIATGYNTLTSESAFAAFISKTGYTRFTLASSDHVNQIAPPEEDYEYFDFRSADHTGTIYDPKLVVTYSDSDTFYQTCEATSATVAVRIAQTGAIRSGVSSVAASVVRGASAVRSAIGGSVAALTKQAGVLRQAVSASTPSIVAGRLLGRVFSCAGAAVGALTRQTGKVSLASASPVALVIRLTGAARAATSSTVVTLSKAALRVLAASAASVPTVLRNTVRTLASAPAAVSVLVRQVGVLLISPTSTTVDVGTAANGDDGYFTDWLYDHAPDGIDSGGNLAIGMMVAYGDYLQMTGWFRFPNVNIPQGATISSAVISFKHAAAFTGNNIGARIYCIQEDNHAAPTSVSDFNTDVGLRTSTYAGWTIYDEDQVEGTSEDTANFATQLQAIINRSGWVSGNAVGVHIANFSNSPAETGSWVTVAGYDHATLTEPHLIVTYAGGRVPIVSAAVATILKGRVLTRTLQAASVGVGYLVRQARLVRSGSAGASGTVSRQMGAVRAATAPATGTIHRATNAIRAGVAGAVAMVGRGFGIVLAGIAGAVADMEWRAAIPVLLEAISSSSVAMTRAVGRTLAITASAVASRTVFLPRVLEAASASVASVGRGYVRVFEAVSASVTEFLAEFTFNIKRLASGLAFIKDVFGEAHVRSVFGLTKAADVDGAASVKAVTGAATKEDISGEVDI